MSKKFSAEHKAKVKASTQATYEAKRQALGGKICSRCKELKPFEAFSVRLRQCKDGTTSRLSRSQCKECALLTNKEKYDPQKSAKSMRRWHLKARYGLAEGGYIALLESQHGGCAICGATSCGGNRKYFCIDHDHKDGTVRGLLCNRCNRMLGTIDDDIKLLRQAIIYLACGPRP